jgi:type I restriction enzyme S subunit
MASEFRPFRLGDVATLASGSTPSTTNLTFWGGSTPWISAKDMGEFWIDDAQDHLTDEGVNAASRLVEPGTVLILTRGMTLHKRVPICRTVKPATPSSTPNGRFGCFPTADPIGINNLAASR